MPSEAFHTAISVLYLQHFPLAHLHIVHSFKCQHVNELVHIIMYSVHLYEYIAQCTVLYINMKI